MMFVGSKGHKKLLNYERFGWGVEGVRLEGEKKDKKSEQTHQILC